MADVINTDTLEIRQSVNYDAGTPPFGVAPWLLISRSQSEIWSVIPRRYRKWVTDHVEEMTQPEKDAVDAAMLEAARDEIIQQIDNVEDVMRAAVLTLLDGYNVTASRLGALLDAIDAAGNLTALKTAAAAIVNPPTFTPAELRSMIRNKLGN